MAVIKTEPKNVQAFLDMISYSEGTYGKGDDGYNVYVGGKFMTTYTDHPAALGMKGVFIKMTGQSSKAAGRYQIIYKFWPHYKKLLGLKDFSPISQDSYAVALLKECGAYSYIVQGDIKSAIKKAASRWASFPNAGYGQPEHDINMLIAAYETIRSKL